MKINVFVQRFFHRFFIVIYRLVKARKNIGRYLVVMSTTDCSKEEGMCSLVDAVSLRCLDLSIRNRNMA